MATINIRDNRQVIDYLSRDYQSFRKALLDLIPSKLPEWTDRSEADFGIVLVELFAYMGDILSYYQDRLANEAFLPTAQERRSVINHLRLIGYEMAPAAAATSRLSVIVANNVKQYIEVRRGDQFATVSTRERPSVTFEYTDEKPLLINTRDAKPNSAKQPDGTPLANFKEIPDIIPVREGRTVANEVIGVSDGTPNQRYPLAQARLLRDTLEIVVETQPPTPPWTLRRNLVLSRPAYTDEQLVALERQERIASTLAFSRRADADYMIETDENDVTTVIFGDGQYGRIPPAGARIVANYRVGGGAAGNVGAGQITVVSRAPQLQLLGAKVVNREAASGGAERESLEQAVRFAPTAFNSMQRAVTAEDYVSLARLFPGVSKARAESTGWNNIKLYIAPTGSGKPPSDILIQDLLAYFEDKRMLTTFIQIEAPSYVSINVTASVEALPYFRNVDVSNAADRAVRALFEFEKVDFKQTLYISKIYEALESVDGVMSVFVSVFQRSGGPDPIAGNGLIQLEQNEIPVPGNFQIKVTGGV
ncbi:MAG TPA: putative baseplate assembly protein [Pyrinomonadaceae bacterium]|nr:putative baseplate assembly protein [Pyrinomonadaceae bacterium]